MFNAANCLKLPPQERLDPIPVGRPIGKIYSCDAGARDALRQQFRRFDGICVLFIPGFYRPPAGNYWLVRRRDPRLGKPRLIIASFVFYGYRIPAYMLQLSVTILYNHATARDFGVGLLSHPDAEGWLRSRFARCRGDWDEVGYTEIRQALPAPAPALPGDSDGPSNAR